MTPHEYVEELERRFHSDEPRHAYTLWLEQQHHQTEMAFTTEDRRRLRTVLHLLMQMAAGLEWNKTQPAATSRERHTA